MDRAKTLGRTAAKAAMAGDRDKAAAMYVEALESMRPLIENSISEPDLAKKTELVQAWSAALSALRAAPPPPPPSAPPKEDVSDAEEEIVIKPKKDSEDEALYRALELDALKPVPPNVTLDDVVGLDDVKETLRQATKLRRLAPHLVNNKAEERTMLFWSGPGCGKSWLAICLAVECGLAFVGPDTASLTSKYHGNSEKLVRHIFRIAREHAPSLLFLDEIDGLFGTSEGDSDVSRRATAQFLQSMTELDLNPELVVYVIGATNFPWKLLDSALRRLNPMVYIDMPTFEMRATLIDKLSREFTMPGLTVDDIMALTEDGAPLDGFSMAELRKVMQAAESIRGATLLNAKRFVFQETGTWAVADVLTCQCTGDVCPRCSSRKITADEIGFDNIPNKPPLTPSMVVAATAKIKRAAQNWLLSERTNIAKFLGTPQPKEDVDDDDGDEE